MEDDRRRELEARMRAERKELVRRIADLEGTLEPVAPDVAIGRLSRLDTMLNQGVNRSSLQQCRHRLAGLERALIRLENDPEFGFCAECGDPIPMARLLAMPETVRCVDCAD